jgi:hypothetical protein
MKAYRISIVAFFLILHFPIRPLYAQIYLSEGFNGFSIPNGWQVQNLGSGPCFWTIGETDQFAMLGSNFLYVNSNSGFGTIANEIITSPIINGAGPGVVKLRFRHHYRDNIPSPIDTGFVEVFNGTSWITAKAYTSTIGQENNPAFAEINLSPYLNPNLQIRFRYVGQFAYYWLIDDVKVFAVPAADLGVSTLQNVETPCALGIPASLTVTIRNYGTQTQSNFPVSYRVANLPAFTEVFSGSLAPGDSVNHTFAVPINTALPGKIKFKSWTSLSGDVETGNDTAFATNYILMPGFKPLDFTFYDGGNLDVTNPGWEEAYGDNALPPNSSWTPSNDVQKLALGSKTARVNLYTTTVRAWMISPPFLVKNGDFLRFKVAVTAYLSGSPNTMGSDDAVYVRVSTDCGQSWTTIEAYTAASGIGNQLENKEVSLSQYSGQTVRIAFFGTDGFIDDPNDCDFHLDDVRVTPVFPADFYLSDLILPPGACGQNAAFPVKIKVVNNGSSLQTSLPASYQVLGLPPVNQVFPVSLPPGADTILQFSTLASIPNPGDYFISAWTTLFEDGNQLDDTVKLRPFFRVGSSFENQQFTGYMGENIGNRWSEASGLNATGLTSTWTSADALQEQSFGTEMARVSLFTNVVKAWLISPPFKPGSDVDLRFKIAVTAMFSSGSAPLGSDDSLIVKVTTNCGQTWQTLRFFTAATTLTNQLVDQIISLNAFAGQTIRIGFYATDGAIDDFNDADVLLDDIRLANNSPVDLELTAITFPFGECGVEPQFPVKVKVVNAGTLTQNSVPVYYQIQGQAVVSQVFPVTLTPGASIQLEFSAQANIPVPGNYRLSAWVALQGDQNQAGDTIKGIPFYRVGQGFDLQDFTDYNGSNLTLGWDEKKGFSGSLQNGSFWSNSNTVQTDSLGSKTAKVNLYGAGQREWLLSPAFRTDTGRALRFKLALTNSASGEADEMGDDDSLIVKISSDCGQTWQNLKSFTKANQLANQLSTQKISLATFTGQTIRVAFYATSGTQFDVQDYDLHIDQVELIDVYQNDLGITSILLPPLNCGLPESMPVKVKLANLGSADQSGFTISYSLNGGSPQTEPFQGSFQALQEQIFQFSVPASLSTTSPSVIRIWTSLSSDQDLSNDSLVSQELLPAPSQVVPVNFSNYNGDNLSVLFPGWKEKAGAIPSGNSSGWTNSAPNQTNWFGTVTARVAFFGNTRREWMISSIFKPLPESEIRFNLALTDRFFTVSDVMGSDDSLKLMISTDCGENWSLIRTFRSNSGLLNTLKPFSADLSSYAGQNCQIAFMATSGNIVNAEEFELHLDSIRMGPLTVSVEKEIRHKNISLYPNPCSGDKLFIKTVGAEDQFQFFSSTGTEYFPSQISGENGWYDVGEMPAGYYFVRGRNTTIPFVLIR